MGLNITIPDAQIDSINLVSQQLSNPVKKIRCLQSKKSAQISFLLTTKVNEYNIYSNDQFINVQLRTESQEIISTKQKKQKWFVDTIVLDAGHGGKDPGAIGVNGLQEKTVTLDVTKKLGRLIERNLGLKVVYTRQEDVFIPLWKRTQIANESKGKLFISIHVNSSGKNHRAKGFETYLLRPGRTEDAIEVAQRENAVIDFEENKTKNYISEENLILATLAQNTYMQHSEFLANSIQTSLDKVLTVPNRGVKQAGFQVLVGASMPNVLIELGFLSNKEEEKLLGKSKYRLKIAKALFESIVDFKEHYETSLIINE